MRLLIRHRTVYEYAPQVERCILRLRLFPSQFATQKRTVWSVHVNGDDVQPALVTGFGDEEALWTCYQPLARVEIEASGEIETDDAAGFLSGRREPVRPSVFLRTTHLTESGEPVRALAESVTGADPLSRMHDLCARTHAVIAYAPGKTGSATTASDALSIGAGVCQDFAHVFISAARLLGSPARYVVGYLAAGDDGHAHTHAWAEAFIPELGWVGFDPTVPVCPTPAYVRLASGLDSADAAPIRGNVSGIVEETMSASVVIAQAQQ
jgi:transglutaminase-like putative cysteine protease